MVRRARAVNSDFRHTLAFAVILARAKKQYSYLEPYLTLTLESQLSDGGWPPGAGVTLSEVFTVLYAVELLDLASADDALAPEIREDALLARDRGFGWLSAHRGRNGLWESGVLSEYPWDGVLTTAWIVHRLCPTWRVQVLGWRTCLEQVLSNMLRQSLDERTWNRSDTFERQRVEARVAAAAARAERAVELAPRSKDLVRVYLSAWRDRATMWARDLADSDLDLATAVFLLCGLYETAELQDRIKSVLTAEVSE